MERSQVQTKKEAPRPVKAFSGAPTASNQKISREKKKEKERKRVVRGHLASPKGKKLFRYRRLRKGLGKQRDPAKDGSKAEIEKKKD